MSDPRSSFPVLPVHRQDVTLANAVNLDHDIEAQDRAPNDYTSPALASYYLTQIGNGLFQAGHGVYKMVGIVCTVVVWLIFCILKIPSLCSTCLDLAADVLCKLMNTVTS